MIKVLILAYDFPPYNSVGAQRPYSWYKYFKQFNIDPIVVTRHWDEGVSSEIDCLKPSNKDTVALEKSALGLVYRTPFIPNLRDRLVLRYGLNKFSILRKMLSVYYKLVEFLAVNQGSRRELYRCAEEVCSLESIDYIIATGEPFVLFKYASKLSKKYNIPWVADYRDEWSNNYNNGRFDRLFYGLIEKKILSNVHKITTTAYQFQKRLSELHNKPVELLLNGYFHEKFDDLDVTTTQKEFVISFSGTLYPYQPIEVFAQGFSKFMRDTPKNVKVRFVGLEFYPEQLGRVKRAFKKHLNLLEFTNRLPHEIALDVLNTSTAFILPADKDHEQVFAKVFDYLALRKTIILCRSDEGILEQIITDTNAGVVCNNAEEVAASLLDLYQKWGKAGVVNCNSSGIEAFSRENQTKKMSRILKEI